MNVSVIIVVCQVRFTAEAGVLESSRLRSHNKMP